VPEQTQGGFLGLDDVIVVASDANSMRFEKWEFFDWVRENLC
jgi:hypothetical protein